MADESVNAKLHAMGMYQAPSELLYTQSMPKEHPSHPHPEQVSELQTVLDALEQSVSDVSSGSQALIHRLHLVTCRAQGDDHAEQMMAAKCQTVVEEWMQSIPHTCPLTDQLYCLTRTLRMQHMVLATLLAHLVL